MRIYRIIIPALLLFCSLPMCGEQYSYVKGANRFEVKETSKEYQVLCFNSKTGQTSRNKNITDRQLRMDAIDLIGAFIVYKDSEAFKSLGSEYFQIYVEGLQLHYYAVLEGMRNENLTVDGIPCIRYSCTKDAYNMQSATYQKNIDIGDLLVAHYSSDKSEKSASLLYKYKDFNSEQYLRLEQDFLVGDAVIPSNIRQFQSVTDRFEMSVFSSLPENMDAPLKMAKSTKPESAPYMQFYYEEMVTSVPLEDKTDYYIRWQKSLSTDGCLYEDILKFCSEKCKKNLPDKNEACLSAAIEAFPGAVSPFGIRQPIDDASYGRAAQAYSQSDFVQASSILKGIIDDEGVSPKVLNLLGASYRFLGKPEDAMPYLLLCFKLYPKTQYLVGNLYLCLEELGFTQMGSLKIFLQDYSIDSWSNETLEN